MNKTVLVTGASRGLGLYFVKRYLEEGDIVFAGARDPLSPQLQELKESYPKTLFPITLDVANTSSVNEAAKRVMEHTDKIDIILNNAAINSSSTFKVIEEADLDLGLEVYNVNSLGPLRVVKAFMSLIRKSTLAKIINISSESGSIGTIGREKEFDYSMSKAALNMATKLLSNYLKKDKIVVLAVHPGWMRTDMGGYNAHLDPYETACRLAEVFKKFNHTDTSLFIDNNGNTFPW